MKKPFDVMHYAVIFVFVIAVAATLAQLLTQQPITAQSFLGFIPVLALAVNNVVAFFKAPPSTLQGALNAGETVTTSTVVASKTTQQGFARVGALVVAMLAGLLIAILAACGASAQQVQTATPVVVDLTNAVCQEVATVTGSPVVEFICQELATVTGKGDAATVTMRYIVSKDNALALSYFRSRVAASADAGGQ